MSTPHLLTYLEREIFFPILNTCALDETAPLATLQQNLIDTLRTLYYPCTTSVAVQHAMAISLLSPRLLRMWEEARRHGFASLLDDAVQSTCATIMAAETPATMEHRPSQHNALQLAA